MHLTSADKRAARDGFQFLVVVGGQRKCYCTTHAEAKSEAGRKGKIVSLGSLHYAARNPATVKSLTVVGTDSLPVYLVIFEDAGPFARTRNLSKGETAETVTDDTFARNITHLPTGMVLYAGDISLAWRHRGPAPNKQAKTALKALRAWYKSLSAYEKDLLVNGYTAGVRKWSPEQDALLRQAHKVANEGSKKANPGLTPAGKRHLIKTMHKAGADTFRKKVAYVRRHMPNVTDPQAFVGYVMQGEKGR